MIKFGAETQRYDGHKGSATNIIRQIMHKAPIYVELQKEIRRGMKLADTAAGQAIISELERKALQREKEMAELRIEMKAARESANHNSALLELQKMQLEELIDALKKESNEKEELLNSEMTALRRKITNLEEKEKKRNEEWCIII